MLSFLFPPICPLCAKELLDKGEHICKICSKKQIFIKEPTCYSCGKSMKNQEEEYCSDCRQHPKNFERGMGLCIYQKPVTDSLAAIKYKNERKFAQYYLEEIRKRKYRELLRLKADAVIPVPIHKKKRRKRVGAAPFAACGFFRYHGMTAEQFAWAVIKSELLYPKRLVFKSENLYFSCMEESLRLGEKMMGNGAELLEKKRTKQKKPKKPKKPGGRGDAFD